jgi:4-hydroxy-tetrahydrodipicolinate synthase
MLVRVDHGGLRPGVASAAHYRDPMTTTSLLRSAESRFGLSCASITPFDAEGGVDIARLLDHLARCLDEGCSSLTLFGTTGEGASVGMSERERTTNAAIAKFGADRLLTGVMANAPLDAAAQANPLLDAGGRGVLLAPPFYFKGPDDDGLYAWFSRAIEAMHAPRGVFLYHIPSVTSVPLSVALIGRLVRAFPGVIAGVKDSGGEWSYTESLLAAHRDLHILVGDERLLARAMRHGASGAINGFSNFCAPRLAPLFEGRDVEPITALVDLLLAYPVTPGVKALVAHVRGDAAFTRTAPPLRPLAAPAAARLVDAFRRL